MMELKIGNVPAQDNRATKEEEEIDGGWNQKWSSHKYCQRQRFLNNSQLEDGRRASHEQTRRGDKQGERARTCPAVSQS